MNTTIKEILNYLKSPSEKVRSTSNDALHDLKNIFILDVVMMLLTMPLTQILAFYNLINFREHAAHNMFIGTDLFFTLLLISFIIPAIEEFIFRFPLKLGYNIFPMIQLLRARSLSDADERVRIYQVKKNWLKRYAYVFYGMATLFALLHLNNFPLSVNIIIFAPILILPQFILGILASYLRLKYDLRYAIFLHGLHNLLFGLLAAISLM